MPFAGFIRPDNLTESVADALTHPELYGLPRGLLAALSLGTRIPSENRVSVTELIDPYQVSILKRRHDYFERPLDMVWALRGKAIHKIAEQGAGADELAEEKLTVEVDGITVSGMADLYSAASEAIIDYKTSNVYALKRIRDNGEPKWEAQLNLYAHLYRACGFDVRTLEVVAICMDHRNYEHERAKGKNEWYPEKVVICRMPLWDPLVAETYLRDRVKGWKEAMDLLDPYLPKCSAEDTWQGKRCARWCAASAHCHQYQQGKK